MIDPLLTDALKPAVDTVIEARDASAVDDSPKFGRLLIVLVVAVLLMGLLTVVSEAFYS
jgi:hypothetical protein